MTTLEKIDFLNEVIEQLEKRHADANFIFGIRMRVLALLGQLVAEND